jgi:hypothetical protein
MKSVLNLRFRGSYALDGGMHARLSRAPSSTTQEATLMSLKKKWRGAVGQFTLLTLAAALIPLPVAAAEARPSPKPATIKASVEKIAASDFAAVPAPRSKAIRTQSSPMNDRSFFKTKPGVIALVVMAAGVGYAVYSVKNDRITSPAKQ